MGSGTETTHDYVHVLYNILKADSGNDSDLLDAVYENYLSAKRKIKFFKSFFETRYELKELSDKYDKYERANSNQRLNGYQHYENQPSLDIQDNRSCISFKSMKNTQNVRPLPSSDTRSLLSLQNNCTRKRPEPVFKRPRSPQSTISTCNSKKKKYDNDNTTVISYSKAGSTISYGRKKTTPTIEKSSASHNPLYSFNNTNNNRPLNLPASTSSFCNNKLISKNFTLAQKDSSSSSDSSEENIPITLSPVIPTRPKKYFLGHSVNTNSTVIRNSPKATNLNAVISSVLNPSNTDKLNNLADKKNVQNTLGKTISNKNMDQSKFRVFASPKKTAVNNDDSPELNLRVKTKSVFERLHLTADSPAMKSNNSSKANNNTSLGSEFPSDSSKNSSYCLRSRVVDLKETTHSSRKAGSKSSLEDNSSNFTTQRTQRNTTKKTEYPSFMPNGSSKPKRKLFVQSTDLLQNS